MAGPDSLQPNGIAIAESMTPTAAVGESVKSATAGIRESAINADPTATHKALESFAVAPPSPAEGPSSPVEMPYPDVVTSSTAESTQPVDAKVSTPFSEEPDEVVHGEATGTTPITEATSGASDTGEVSSTTPPAGSESDKTSAGSADAAPATTFKAAGEGGMDQADVDAAREYRNSNPEVSEEDALKEIQRRKSGETSKDTTTPPSASELDLARTRLDAWNKTTPQDAVARGDFDPTLGREVRTEEEATAFITRQKEAQQKVIDAESVPNAEELSYEERMKNATKEFNESAEDFFDNMFSNGNEALAADALDRYNKAFTDIVGMQATEDTRQMAREFVKGIFNPEAMKNPAETAKMRNIREKLQEIARLRMQLAVQAETVKRMNGEEKNLKDEVNKAESNYLNETNESEKQKKQAIFAGKTMHLARYQDAIVLQKRMGRDSIVKLRQARGYIHRKLGTHSGAYNLVFGAGTALTQGVIGAGNAMESVFS